MKRLLIIILALNSPLWGETAEPKPLVSLSASCRVLDSDTSLQGRSGKTREKTITLRVVVQNVSQKTIPASQLTGDAFVARLVGDSEKLVKHPIDAADVPELKPNEKVTIDLGKAELHTLEWGKRKFKEKLEEWKVTCRNGQVIIGSTVSSDKFAALEKEHANDPPNKAARETRPLPSIRRPFKP